jgi:hypothetical protein
MKNISIKQLQNFIIPVINGQIVTYGKNVYKLDILKNGVKWICYMSYDKYIKDIDKHNKNSVGWFALLRIA